MKLSVYVDDNLLAGPSRRELEEAFNEITQFVSGRIIETVDTVDDNGHKWSYLDLLGSDLHYSRSAQSFRICMQKYIEKNIEKKFGIVVSKAELSPNFDESALVDPDAKPLKDYNPREVVGVLQWVSTICRPDVAVPVGTLAKYVGLEPTVNFARACRKVMRYLATIKSQGITYSPT